MHLEGHMDILVPTLAAFVRYGAAKAEAEAKLNQNQNKQ